MKKIITVLGTRPEIIKLSPLIPLLDKEFEHKIIHTGQHYSENMDKVFFNDLKLRQPDFFLNIGSGTQAFQTGTMTIKIEEILLKEKPDLVIVFGDVNSTLAGSLAATKIRIKTVHIEAGCRSFNRNMPEEFNRIIADHCSDLLFAPDEIAVKNLEREGLKERVFLTGSLAVDAVERNSKIAMESKILEKLGLKEKEFATATMHRAENTEPNVLREIVSGLNELSEKIKVVFPVHPRTVKILKQEEIDLSEKILVIDPLGYLDFLQLLQNSSFCLTDSGGIQEEAAVLNVPCLILRTETEWLYLIEAGKNKLIGVKKQEIVSKVLGLINSDKLNEMRKKEAPFTKNVAEKMLEVLKKEI